jgi:hypothetical protein
MSNCAGGLTSGQCFGDFSFPMCQRFERGGHVNSGIHIEYRYDDGVLGKGGTATLFVNEKQVAQGRVEKTIPARFSADETFDIGLDTGSPISEDYHSPFRSMAEL